MAYTRASRGIFICLFFLCSSAYADTIYLKNGRQLEGIVKSQTTEEVVLEIAYGTISFAGKEVLSVQRDNDGSREQLRRQWQQTKIKQEAEYKKRLAEQQLRKEQEPKNVRIARSDTGHVMVNAVLNDSVTVPLMIDTGATFITLAKGIGDRLGYTVAASGKNDKIVEIQLGDGRKVKAQYVVLRSVKVQDAVENDVDAAIFLEDNPDLKYYGVLGMSFLGRYNFGFNNKEGKLTLEKSR